MRGRVTAAIATAVVLALPAAGCAAPAGARPGTAGQRAAAVAGPGAPATAGGQGAPTRTPSAVARLCGPPDAPGHLIMVRAADGVRLAAVEAGAGERGVVLIPELGQMGKCGWWDFAAYLAARGYHVLLFDHRCTGGSACAPGRAGGGLMSDIRGAVTWMRHAGAARIALVGASQGGSEALIAAAVPPRGVTGVVALSADELALPLASAPYPATALTAVGRLRLPVLFAVAASDPYVSVQATRHLLAAAGSRRKRLILLGAGAGHGWDLVSPALPGGERPAFGRTVLAFLRGVTR